MSKKNYLVSAVVSTYKSARFIRGLLEDLEAQTISDRLEIVVVDSNSPENEGTIVREFQQRYDNIVYIHTARRETTHAAFSRCARAAHGKYLTLACTDDRHKTDALERMAAVLESRPDIALVYANSHITRKENETFEHHTSFRTYRWIDFDPLRLLEGCFIGPQPMWRKSLHEKYGYFDGKLESAGDWEFWLRLAGDETFLHIDETLGLYLYSPTSSEHQNPKRHQRELARVKQKYIQREPPLKARKKRAELRQPADSGMLVLVQKGAQTATEELEQSVERVRVGRLSGERLAVRVVKLDSQVPENALDVNVSPRTMTALQALNEAAVWESKYVVLLSPDVVVTRDCLHLLRAVADSDDAVAAVGPVCNLAPAIQEVDPDYDDLEMELESFAARRADQHKLAWDEVPHLGGFCLLLKGAALRQAAGVNCNLPLHMALWDLYRRMRNRGWKLACARGVYVHHSELTTEEGTGYSDLAAAEAMAARDELEAAEQAFNEVLEFDPANLHAWLGLAEACRKLNRHAQAQAILTQASRTYPGNLDVLAGLGLLSLGMGSIENAHKALQHIRRIDPKHSAIAALAQALKDAGTEEPAPTLASPVGKTN